jgi:endonuclease-3
MTKQPFDVDTALARIADAVRPWPPAALFGLANEGYSTPFEQLIACIISIRTLDEVTVDAARRLFAHARTPAELLALSPEEIDGWITPCTFHGAKAYQLQEIARTVEERHGGDLPCDFAALTALRGVGPKCANLVLGIGCNQPAISVDVHVHRVTNRWGYVHTTTPEKTMAALQETLPRPLWVTINRLLVPFGKHICTGRAPHCSTCPVLPMCAQVGVKSRV